MRGIDRIQPVNRVYEVTGVQPVGEHWVSSSTLWNIRQARAAQHRNAEMRNNTVAFSDVLKEVMQRQK